MWRCMYAVIARPPYFARKNDGKSVMRAVAEKFLLRQRAALMCALDAIALADRGVEE